MLLQVWLRTTLLGFILWMYNQRKRPITAYSTLLRCWDRYCFDAHVMGTKCCPWWTRMDNSTTTTQRWSIPLQGCLFISFILSLSSVQCFWVVSLWNDGLPFKLRWRASKGLTIIGVPTFWMIDFLLNSKPWNVAFSYGTNTLGSPPLAANG